MIRVPRRMADAGCESTDPGGAIDETIAELHKAIERDPANPSSYLCLARLYHRSGHTNQALAAYLRLISAAPSIKSYVAIARRPPIYAWPYIRQWLNAKWQLRACTRVGRWARVTGSPFIDNQGEMIVGDRTQVLSHYSRSVFAVFPGGRLEVGEQTVINYGADIAATKLVRIGADCLIGTHAIILDNDFHEVSDRSRRPEGRPVIIGDRVWVGNRSTILPGVTVGDDAVVGAGSVVLTDVAPSTVVMGNPARPVKRL